MKHFIYIIKFSSFIIKIFSYFLSKWMRTTKDGSPSGSSGLRAECEGLFFGRNEVSEKKIRSHVQREQSKTIHLREFKKVGG